MWLLYALPIGNLLAPITRVKALALTSMTGLLNERLSTSLTGYLLRDLNHSLVPIVTNIVTNVSHLL